MKLLTSLFNNGQNKSDLLNYIIKNNVEVTAAPGNINQDKGIMILSVEDPEAVIKNFPNYTFILVNIQNNQVVYNLYQNTENTSSSFTETPKDDENTCSVTVKFTNTDIEMNIGYYNVLYKTLQN